VADVKKYKRWDPDKGQYVEEEQKDMFATIMGLFFGAAGLLGGGVSLAQGAGAFAAIGGAIEAAIVAAVGLGIYAIAREVFPDLKKYDGQLMDMFNGMLGGGNAIEGTLRAMEPQAAIDGIKGALEKDITGDTQVDKTRKTAAGELAKALGENNGQWNTFLSIVTTAAPGSLNGSAGIQGVDAAKVKALFSNATIVKALANGIPNAVDAGGKKTGTLGLEVPRVQRIFEQGMIYPGIDARIAKVFGADPKALVTALNDMQLSEVMQGKFTGDTLVALLKNNDTRGLIETLMKEKDTAKTIVASLSDPALKQWLEETAAKTDKLQRLDYASIGNALEGKDGPAAMEALKANLTAQFVKDPKWGEAMITGAALGSMLTKAVNGSVTELKSMIDLAYPGTERAQVAQRDMMVKYLTDNAGAMRDILGPQGLDALAKQMREVLADPKGSKKMPDLTNPQSLLQGELGQAIAKRAVDGVLAKDDKEVAAGTSGAVVDKDFVEKAVARLKFEALGAQLPGEATELAAGRVKAGQFFQLLATRKDKDGKFTSDDSTMTVSGTVIPIEGKKNSNLDQIAQRVKAGQVDAVTAVLNTLVEMQTKPTTPTRIDAAVADQAKQLVSGVNYASSEIIGFLSNSGIVKDGADVAALNGFMLIPNGGGHGLADGRIQKPIIDAIEAKAGRTP